MEGNSKVCFDSVASEGMKNRGKLFKKFEKSRLPIDQENYKKACFEVKKLITEKSETTLKQNLTKNIDKLKELWKTIKAVGLS